MPDTEETTQTIIVPVPSDRLWFDPRVIMSACQMTTQDIDTATGVITMVATADASRVAIGFSLLAGTIGTLDVGPWTDPDIASFVRINGGVPQWFYLHEHLNVVCQEWFGVSLVGASVRVTTIRRNT